MQALLHLSHTSSLFCSGYFGDGGSLKLFAQAGLQLPSSLYLSLPSTRIASVSHWLLADMNVLFYFIFVVLGLELRAYTLSHSTSPFL
jgi:hypothetical protein